MKNLFKNIMNSVMPAKEEPAPAPAPTGKFEGNEVAGTYYRESEIKKMGKKNPNYKLSEKEIMKKGLYEKAIYELTFNPSCVELIPEPDNPHDPKAIKVVMDGVHVGYIKKGSCSHIRNLINSDSIESINGVIFGGNYKYVEYDQYKKKSKMDTGFKNFIVKVNIIVKDK